MEKKTMINYRKILRPDTLLEREFIVEATISKRYMDSRQIDLDAIANKVDFLYKTTPKDDVLQLELLITSNPILFGLFLQEHFCLLEEEGIEYKESLTEHGVTERTQVQSFDGSTKDLILLILEGKRYD